MDRNERRTHGVHYTTHDLVLRVLKPLFLDDLETRLHTASTIEDLHAFLKHLTSLTFLDPACGTGNFLVVALRCLRDLQARARTRLLEFGVQPADVETLPGTSLHQFYGIERDAEAAALAHENLQKTASGLSRHTTPNIVVANALRIDWNDVLPAERASFVFGNPPFVGMAWMTPEQREDHQRAFSFTDTRGMRIGRLDYAAGFFAQSIAYGLNRNIRYAYVVTNSLCQGEHPRSLGPIFAKHGVQIDFACRPFAWTTDGSQKRARVHVVIIGFSQQKDVTKRIFEFRPETKDTIEERVLNINLYLTAGPDVYPTKRDRPLLAGYPLATKGSQPTDGGHLLVAPDDLKEVLADPIAAKYVRRYMQAWEFLWDVPRYCLWLVDAPPEDLETSPVLRDRTARVRRLRETSRTPKVRERAAAPHLFTQIRQPKQRFLALPEVSSEKRTWIPAAFVEPEIIAGNKLIVWQGADLWHFGMLQSSMFMAWLRAMAGRLKSDISISPDLTYCTFPFPAVDAAKRSRVVEAVENVLHVRTTFVGKSLGDLYEPGRTPKALLDAHTVLDEAVDAGFGTSFSRAHEADRLRVLLDRYVEFASESPGRKLSSAR